MQEISINDKQIQTLEKNGKDFKIKWIKTMDGPTKNVVIKRLYH
jgi:hypothetical protein